MPVAERDGTGGKAMRGVCLKCGQITKAKDAIGRWVSQCAHDAKSYEGRLMPVGRSAKRVPVIPATLDRGYIPPEGVGVVAAAGGDPEESREPVRGFIDPDEPRDDELPATSLGADGFTYRHGEVPPGAKRRPERGYKPDDFDPLEVDPRGWLKACGVGMRRMARALELAQAQIREYVEAVARASIEIGQLHDRVDDLEAELARLRAEAERETDAGWREGADLDDPPEEGDPEPDLFDLDDAG